MAEYIGREVLTPEEEEKYWCEECCNFDKKRLGMDGMAYCKLTECRAWCQEFGGNCKGFNVPATDVVEVRRGEWLEERCNHKPYRLNNPEKWVKYKCSECGYSNGRKHSNYCPNCGAKMDGKGGGE